MKKIYISPSNQTSNIYATGNTNEGVQCQAIGERVGELLQSTYKDIEVKVAPISQKALDRANEARNWGNDLMVCIHTNASGSASAGKANGTLGIYYKGDYKTLTLTDAEIQERKNFTQLMVDKVAILTGINRGLITNQQTELVFCECPGGLIEMEFHDNAKGSDWIIANHEPLANALVEAIAEYLNLAKKDEGDTPTENPSEETPTTNTYELFVDCPVYSNANNAINKINSTGTYSKGIYYLYNKYPDGYKGVFNITRDSTGSTAGAWINPEDNKVEEVATEFKVGDLVSIKEGAVWYDTGSAVPSWVLKKNWYISSISGDRAVLNKPESGTNSINSPISTTYLVLVSTASSDTPTEDVTTLYKVRISWEDEALQIGAYSDLQNAIKVADANATKGYKVFDESGNVVYEPENPTDTPVEDTPSEEPEIVTYNTQTPIVDNSTYSEDVIVRVIKAIRKNNSSFDIIIAKAFFNIGPTYRISSLYAISQSIHETGWFRFQGSSVSPSQHNYCGLGATGGGVSGASFDTIEQGVEAQFQHLYAYGCKDELPEGVTLYDPRYNLVTRGKAPTWEELTGKWAVPGYDTATYSTIEEMMKLSTIESPLCYGHKILNIAQRLLNTEVTQEEIDEYYGRVEDTPTEEPEEPITPEEPTEEPETPDDPTEDIPTEEEDKECFLIKLLKLIWNFIVSLFKK